MPTDHEQDTYELKYMDGADCLARSRLGMPWWLHLVMALSMAVAVLAARQDAIALLALPLLAVVWLLFMYLRVTVTRTHVHVQFGVFGPKIPVDRIESARTEDYSPLRYRGWGLKYGLDGSVAYSVPTKHGRGVRIHFSTAKNKPRSVFVSAQDPEHLVQAIQRARASRVRVEDPAVQLLAEAPASDEFVSQHSMTAETRNSK